MQGAKGEKGNAGFPGLPGRAVSSIGKVLAYFALNKNYLIVYFFKIVAKYSKINVFIFQGEPGRHGKDGLMGSPGYKVFTQIIKQLM